MQAFILKYWHALAPWCDELRVMRKGKRALVTSPQPPVAYLSGLLAPKPATPLCVPTTATS